jgi:hypothetical protein
MTRGHFEHFPADLTRVPDRHELMTAMPLVFHQKQIDAVNACASAVSPHQKTANL